MHVCMFTAMDTPTTPSVTKVWKMETEFTEGEQIVVRLRPNSSKGVYYLYIPVKGTATNKRVEIVFSKAALEGLSEHFAEFVAEQFQSVMGKWKNVMSMHKWVANDRHAWKKSVRDAWEYKCERVTRHSVTRKLEMKSSVTASPVYSAKNDSTVTIAAPHLFGHRGTVRVLVREQKVLSNGRRVKAHVLVWLPQPIRKEYSMGVQFGINKRWIKFVGEYVNYAVSKWQTLEAAKNWATNCFKNFREFVNVLFERGGYHNLSVKRVWRLAPSTMETDPVYNARGNDGDPDFAEFKDGSNPGFGIFCTVRGRHTFDWAFPNDDRINYIANKKREHLTDLQKKYQATACRKDPDFVWVPTTDALECGAVPVQYLMNHSRKNPSHELVPDGFTGDTILNPLSRESVPKEEYKFHYRLEKSPDDTAVQNMVLLRADDAVAADDDALDDDDDEDANAVAADDSDVDEAEPEDADAGDLNDLPELLPGDDDDDDDDYKPVCKFTKSHLPVDHEIWLDSDDDDYKPVCKFTKSHLPVDHEIWVDEVTRMFGPDRDSSDAEDPDVTAGKVDAPPASAAAASATSATASARVNRAAARANRAAARASASAKTRKVAVKTSRADRARARAARAESASLADTNPRKKTRRHKPPARPPIGKAAGSFTDAAEGVYRDPVDGRAYYVYDYMQDPYHRAGVGQCMFVAIADQLKQISGRHLRSYQDLRKLAVANQLGITRSPEFVPNVHRSVAQCNKMKLASTYAGDPELAALRHELMVNIRILRDENGQQRWQWYGDEIASRPTVRIVHTYRSPHSRINHYMSLRAVPQVVPVDEGTTYKL